MILDEVEAVAVRRLSPTYTRVELGGPALADFGVAGPRYDQRIKLLFPGAAGRLPSFPAVDESWYAAWLALPADERGHLRTYTVRDVLGRGPGTRLVVDFVLHLDPGATGPGSAWAARARVGDRLVVVAPRRGHAFGGIEFDPQDASRLLLVADETAVPAACSILEMLPAEAVGSAFLEVPCAADVQPVAHPGGVTVTWLPRERAQLGSLLHPAVVAHFDGRPPPAALTGIVIDPDLVDPDLWETPCYSSSGADVTLSPASVGAPPHAGLYAWIAGESGVVTLLRRHLVAVVGLDRRQVAFMGYWRRGVAMRS